MNSVVLTSEAGSKEPASIAKVKQEKDHLFQDVTNKQVAHLADLEAFHENRPPTVYLYTTLSYVNYVRRWIVNFVVTFVSNPSMPIFHPLDFLFMVFIIPLFIVGMLILELILNGGEKLGFGVYVQRISAKWGDNLTPANWWDPRIFSPATRRIVDDGKKALNSPNHQPAANGDELAYVSSLARSFNIDIAQTLLLFSAIMYERDHARLQQAHKIMAQIIKDRKKATPENYAMLGDILNESEKRIHTQAAVWEVEFMSLTELNTFGGPFAGMFWSVENNFIVVSFKGSAPTDYEDWLIDFTWQRTDGREYLFGNVHDGFYKSLFPSVNEARSNRTSPYFTIVRALRDRAAKIRAQSGEKVNVWVTGHSLGAALAGLFFTRLLHSPKDIGNDCVVRDGYFFAMPRVGDDDFAAGFASSINRPFDRPNTLWRVSNGCDIVARNPPGYTDPDSGRYISQDNMLNYTHIGEGIHFFEDARTPVSTRRIFGADGEPVIIERNQTSLLRRIVSFFKRDETPKIVRKSSRLLFSGLPYVHPKGSPIPFLEWLLPTPVRDHIPARYLYAMENARAHFEDVEGKVCAIIPEADSTSSSKEA